MASTAACATLADAFAALSRTKRSLLGPARGASTLVVLTAMAELGRPRTSDLAEHLGLDVSTVSRHVAVLRREGMVTSSPDLADARNQPLTLTDEGHAELDRRRQAIACRLADQLHSWDDQQVTRLADLLCTFVLDTSAEGSLPAGPPPSRA